MPAHFTICVLVGLGLGCAAVAMEQRGEQPIHSPGAMQRPDTGQAERRAGFSGDQACVSCHAEISHSYHETSHFLTSQQPSRTSVLGSFKEDKSTLVIADAEPGSEAPRLSFTMEARGDGFYETALAERKQERLTRSERIDLVIGAGVRGQTYLYWNGSELFELPVSFWSDGQRWINSPGYRDGTANFSRHVNPRCLECHVSYIKPLSDDPQTNLYDRSSLVTGITCEGCHGPGEKHVTQERGAPLGSRLKLGDSIVNPAKLDRDRQVDQCALCHNGTQRAELQAAFSYLPGKKLDEYLAPNAVDSADHPDVHGNQVGLLKRSKCYLSSPGMSCSTCHDVHVREQAVSTYSAKCLSCHRWQSCGASRQLGPGIVHDCIGCHMPLEQTEAIVSETAGSAIRTSIRTHWIRVYTGTVPTSGHGR